MTNIRHDFPDRTALPDRLDALQRALQHVANHTRDCGCRSCQHLVDEVAVDRWRRHAELGPVARRLAERRFPF